MSVQKPPCVIKLYFYDTMRVICRYLLDSLFEFSKKILRYLVVKELLIEKIINHKRKKEESWRSSLQTLTQSEGQTLVAAFREHCLFTSYYQLKWIMHIYNISNSSKIEQIMKFTKNENNDFDKSKLTEICQTEVDTLNEEEIHSVLDSFVNISRYGAKRGLTGKNMQSFLKDNTLIDEDKIQTFVTQFQSQISEQNIVKMINLGKLIDLRWNVCSFLEDQKCKEINKIFVKLELTVQNSSGEVIKDQFVLSISEFKAFKEVISEINEVAQQYDR